MSKLRVEANEFLIMIGQVSDKNRLKKLMTTEVQFVFIFLLSICLSLSFFQVTIMFTNKVFQNCAYTVAGFHSTKSYMLPLITTVIVMAVS